MVHEPGHQLRPLRVTGAKSLGRELQQFCRCVEIVAQKSFPLSANLQVALQHDEVEENQVKDLINKKEVPVSENKLDGCMIRIVSNVPKL